MLFLFSELFSVTTFQCLINYIKLFLPFIKKSKSVDGVYREKDSNNLKTYFKKEIDYHLKVNLRNPCLIGHMQSHLKKNGC